MIKSYYYEIILYYFQIVLRNSLDPDSGVFWIRIEIFGWIRIRVPWIRIRNTAAVCTQFTHSQNTGSGIFLAESLADSPPDGQPFMTSHGGYSERERRELLAGLRCWPWRIFTACVCEEGGGGAVLGIIIYHPDLHTHIQHTHGHHFSSTFTRCSSLSLQVVHLLVFKVLTFLFPRCSSRFSAS